MPSAKEIFIEMNKCHNLMLCFNHNTFSNSNWEFRECGIVSRRHIYGEIRRFHSLFSLINSPKTFYFICCWILCCLIYWWVSKKSVVKIYIRDIGFDFCIHNSKIRIKKDEFGSQWCACGHLCLQYKLVCDAECKFVTT